ncbi:hypothetical protein HPB49_019540 [Dermacentor silvarum]|uniref:Uncharacterized protein n=1 Tax=Dermacentor silvarum TaxID=543639 RepID=A0ACB8DF83_DERSI|nr:hypothetical protein HPB49_019540 [Dermacentor silvarum]
MNLPITTSTAKLFATGLFHPLRSLLPLHRYSQLARLSLTRQGHWLLAQAGISPIPVSTFTSPISTPAPNLQYTIYSDSQAAIHNIQNRTLPHSLQQEVEGAVSALPPSTVFLRWVPGHSGIDGNELAHQLARDASNRAPLIPWPKPSEDCGILSLRRTIKEVYLHLRLDKCLYPPPHPSLTVPEACLLRHVQMNALVTPSRLFLYRYRFDPSCPN